MKVYKILAISFVLVALILSHVMCASVAFAYCNMLWGIQYAGYSAPAGVAFLLILPYMLGIIAALVMAYVFWRKYRKQR